MSLETVNIHSGPLCLREDALEVVKILRAAGHTAYFAGGCVRDLLLRLEPKDFDVATDASPTRVRELFHRTQAVGASFGVILVRIHSSVIEVATFRTDGEYHDGRHPSAVQFATAEEDAQRRDFTINGLFLDPIDDRVVDYVGGQEDLRNRLLRAIGDPKARFAEDHLRLLRAIRFAARFDLDFDQATAAALAAEVPKLRRITPERIADELRRILTPPTRFSAWLLMYKFGLLAEIFRHLPATNAETTPSVPGRSIFLSLAPGMPMTFPTVLLAGAISFLSETKPGKDVIQFFSAVAVQKLIRVLRQDLKISNAETDAITETARGVAILLADSPPTLAQRKRFLAMPTSRQSIEMIRALAATGNHVERAAAEELALQPLLEMDVAPKPLLNGDDLVASGMSPGPRFKKILEAVYDAQLEDRVRDAAGAAALAKALAGKQQP